MIPIAQARLLWWLANMDDPPTWQPDKTEHVSWPGDSISYLRPEGLGRPQVRNATIRAMMIAGLIEAEDLTVPANVIPLPRGNLSSEFKYRSWLHAQVGGQFDWNRPQRILLTEKGRAAAPSTIPYPWVPWLNGRRDITQSETERLMKVAAYNRITPASPPNPPGPDGSTPPGSASPGAR